jgi:NADP-dependent 3-hydroxy acid dehydrogenase YdfG
MAEERVLLITGGSTGIGAATARAAVESGWRVVLGARGEDGLAALAAELGGGEHAIPLRCDVTEVSDLEALTATAVEGFGRLDAVFANAGLGARRGFLEESPERWREMVLTNVLGVALTIRATLPHLLEADSGHYVVTGSIAGRRHLPGSVYSATKWAVGALAESLRQELRQTHENRSIRVTLLEPGMTDTPFFEDPPADILEPEDLARAVMFALEQPGHVDVNDIAIRPISQSN